METRYDELIASLRAAAQPDRDAPPALFPYLAKVRDGAYAVTDADVEQILAAGHSEDEVFEHTVAAAVSAGLERLDAGLRAVEASR